MSKDSKKTYFSLLIFKYLGFLFINVGCLFILQPVFANTVDLSIQPQLNWPINTTTTQRNEVANFCRQQQCCIYNDQFYSEGAIITLTQNIILQCTRNPNVIGANALSWVQLK